VKALSILILDDETRLAEELAEYLEAAGYRPLTASRPSEAFRALESSGVDIAIVDIKLPEYDGLEFLRRLKDRHPTVETIVMSGHGDMDNVIEALRLGAFDYLRKPFASFDLQTALGRTRKYLEAQRESRRYAELCATLNEELSGGSELVGSSAAMDRVRESIAVAAENSDAPVLIGGESGTGKELVARRIHALGPRASGRFVPVNCAAVPREMFESEFFGHERGAFTDARSAREGLFRAADGGTLFLDEVGEVPIDLQAKLLRAIEERRVRPVGSDEERSADARIVCATNRNLAAAVEAGGFRRDLYYRLAVIEIALPPLRERNGDVMELAEHFMRRFAGSDAVPRFTSAFADRLSRYSFPGNVRELRNIIERAAIAKRQVIDLDALGCLPVEAPAEDRDRTAADRREKDDLNLDLIERETIVEALRRSNGVAAAAARLLGITRQSLDRRMERYGIDRR
jgi:DNA-binding NtrC family response regulator